MRSVLAVATIAVLLAGSTAFGSMVVTAGATAPTDNLSSITQPTDGSIYPWKNRNGGEIQQSGSTFLVGEGGLTIDTLTLKIKTDYFNDGAYHAPQGDVRLVIFDAASLTDRGMSSSTLGNPNITAPILYDQTVAFPSMELNTEYFLEFDIDDLALAAGDYGFWAVMATQVENERVTVYRRTTNDYANSTMFTMSDSVTGGVNKPTQDFAFYVQEAVPEPATMSLLALAGMGALLRRKK